MRKIFIVFYIAVFAFPFLSPNAHAASVSAQFACVMDAQTGQVLFEKNAHQKHSMASTTKIMTALLALEHGKGEDIVSVSKNAAGTEGTSLYLAAGDKVSLSDLIYGLMLQSGNDAAIAIAEHISGSVSAFAKTMTERAKEIGAQNTTFQNPNGLDAEDHYTTAYDLALITREALKNDTFSEICSTKQKTIQNGTQTVINHNKLLSMYPGCIGVKTGFTKKTGRCLVSAAKRDGRTFICVTLNAPDDWNDHTRLLNDAFATTVRFPLLAKGMTVNSVTVTNGTADSVEVCAEEDFFITERPDTRFQNTEIRLKLPENIEAPIAKGEILGIAEIYFKDQLLHTVNLLAASDVTFSHTPPTTLWGNFFKKLLYFGCTGGKNVV